MASRHTDSTPGDSSETVGDFVSVANEFCRVSRQRVVELEKLARENNVSPWQYGLEHGDFDLVEVDIIKMMLEPASSVHGYQIVRPLGRGGMGVVYQARQLSLNRDVALKTILLSQLANPTAVKRFENEAKILASVTHPNIVTAFDFGRHDGRLFLAMELVRGKDVQRLIDHLGNISESLVWHIVRQAAAGLAQAAQAGVIHRDIKPANLLLVNPPDGFPLPVGVPLVKIADFGLSTLVAEQDESANERLTSASMHVGSPLYMAPEQIESKEASIASDIFSLGATAWHMLVGEPPLSGLKLRGIITRRLTEPTESVGSRVPGISDATTELVADMLQIDTEQRLPDYEQLLRRIDSVLKGLPADYKPMAWLRTEDPRLSTAASDFTDRLSETTAFERSKKPASRSRASVWIAIASIAVLGLMLAMVAIWSRGTKDETRRQGVYDSRFTLFDGRTLAGWVPKSGSWAPTEDAEGGRVLSGTDGTIAYDYSRLLRTNQPEVFAIEVSVRVVDGKAGVEFDFGRDMRNDLDRRVVEIGEDSMVFGIRGIEPELRAQRVFAWDGDPPVLVRIERQGDTWWLLRDGQELTQFDDLHEASSNRLLLTAEEGTTQFSDISFLPADG